MAKKLKLGPLDNLDDVEEQAKEYYAIQTDGKFVLTGAEYNYAAVKALKDEAGKYRIELKDAKTKLSETENKLGLWGEHTPEDVLPKIERIAELETASKGKVPEEKLVELAEQRAKALMVPYEKKLLEANTKLQERDQKIQAYDTAEKRAKVLQAVSAVAGELGFEEKTYAQPDGALNLISLGVFKVDDSGNVVTSDTSGFTPGLPPRDALPDLLTKHSYLGKPSLGGGATGSGNGGANGAPEVFKQNNRSVRAALQKANPKEYDRQWNAAKAAGMKTQFDEYKPKS